MELSNITTDINEWYNFLEKLEIREHEYKKMYTNNMFSNHDRFVTYTRDITDTLIKWDGFLIGRIIKIDGLEFECSRRVFTTKDDMQTFLLDFRKKHKLVFLHSYRDVDQVMLNPDLSQYTVKRYVIDFIGVI